MWRRHAGTGNTDGHDAPLNDAVVSRRFPSVQDAGASPDAGPTRTDVCGRGA